MLKYFAITTDKNTAIDDTHYSKLQRNRAIAMYGIFQCLLRCVPKGVFPHDLMVAYWRTTEDYRREKQRLGHSTSPAVFFKAVIETPNTILRVLNAYGEGIRLVYDAFALRRELFIKIVAQFMADPKNNYPDWMQHSAMLHNAETVGFSWVASVERYDLKEMKTRFTYLVSHPARYSVYAVYSYFVSVLRDSMISRQAYRIAINNTNLLGELEACATDPRSSAILFDCHKHADMLRDQINENLAGRRLALTPMPSPSPVPTQPHALGNINPERAGKLRKHTMAEYLKKVVRMCELHGGFKPNFAPVRRKCCSMYLIDGACKHQGTECRSGSKVYKHNCVCGGKHALANCKADIWNA